jgi:putative acetyltransferase
MTESVSIRDERPADFAAIRTVVTAAFGQDAEARLVDALREQGYARVALVAELDRAITGYVLLSDLPIETATGPVSALALAPVAVDPRRQRQGIGSQLIREALARAAIQGHRIVVVLGHRDFYPRFGFSPELARPLASPYAGESFMALELVSGALAGVVGEVRYPPPFSAF